MPAGTFLFILSLGAALSGPFLWPEAAMDRAVFFAEVRRNPFGGKLSQPQVDGLTALLDAAPAGMPDRHLAYCLATAFHETSRTMQPIHEFGSVEYLRGMYDITGRRPAKARELGNIHPGDGVRYAGRGYVQLTGRTNYRRAGGKVGAELEDRPDLAMDPAIAARVLFAGCQEGWFTGKRLADYFRPGETEGDPVGARRIINGQDCAKDIAAYYRAFLFALTKAQAVPVGRAAPVPLPPPPDIPRVEPAPRLALGFWAGLLQAFRRG